MDSFAFIIHPIDPKRDISRKFPLLGRIVNPWMIDHIAPLFPPVYLSEVEGITSAFNGKVIKGWLVACPLIPKHFIELPEHRVYKKIIQTGHMVEKHGAKIIGLGAYTSVVGDGGQTIANALDIPVTTGDSYTVATVIQALRQAADMMGIPVEETCAAVIGANGAIGSACAEWLALEVPELYLVGRRQDALYQLRERLEAKGGPARIHVSTSLDVVQRANYILSVTSALNAVIEPESLRPGTVICDVARPRDVSLKLTAVRDDVLVIDGGMVDVPGNVDFHFDFGLPRGKAYACMAETIALALEGRFVDYTVGKQISFKQVQEISEIAFKHGFKLSGIRSFERPITIEHIERVRQNALM